MVVSVSHGALPLYASERSFVARGDYRPDLNGLRAIATLTAVGFHAGVIAGGLVEVR